MSTFNVPPPGVSFTYRSTPLDLFYRTVTAISYLDHDERNCRVLTLNGDIFYSPNCMRDVTLPSPNAPSLVRNTAESDVSEFHNPLWWNDSTAYLAFLPLEPVFDTAPFDRLAIIPWVPYGRRGYGLDPPTHISWHRLEVELSRLVETLFTKYGLPPVEKIINHPLGFPIHHAQASGFRKQANRVRKWFSCWMALISFCIAVSLELGREDYRTAHYPGWFKFLLEGCKYDHNLLSDIQMTLGSFAPHTERAGIFLEIAEPPHHQYSVEFFRKYSVPVWYPWGRKEVQAARQKPAIGRLAPPVHLLQEPFNFIPQDISPQTPVLCRGNRNDKPWVAFLQARERLRTQVIEHEDQLARQRRINREKQPPVVKTVVYVWELQADDSWKREKVDQRDHRKVLSMYKGKNSVYNGVLNEWDCGDFDDEDSNDEDSESDDEDFGDLSFVDDSFRYDAQAPSCDIVPTSELSYIEDALRCEAQVCDTDSTPFATTTTLATGHDFEFEPLSPLEILNKFYGFVPPLPDHEVQHKFPEFSNRDKLELSNAVGGLGNIEDFLRSPEGKAAMLFLSQWSSDPVSTPSNDLFDLSSGNRMPLAGTFRIKSMVKHSENLYLFCFRNQPEKWQLAVTNILDALFICRLKVGLNQDELVLQLVKLGIRFRTLLPLPYPMYQPSPAFIPWRLSGSLFTKANYDAYVKSRNALLRNPRVARAALQRGGIVWRLAISSVGLGEIISGPSATMTIHQIGASYQVSPSGPFLCDDTLHPTEEDLICGVTRTFTCMSFF